MIITNVTKLRDPFILVDNGVYYMYGTNVEGDWNEQSWWDCYKNDTGSLDGEWKKLGKPIAVVPEDSLKNRWAPEVHKYKDAYYMFTTYYSKKLNRRGCTILKSDSPEGPFVEISDGTITPRDWDAIDGTLYIDSDNTPWLIFVHEWTCTDDGIGRMAAAKLSDDLTHLISEPIELFRADDPKWACGHRVTDGCFMYTTKNGSLLMIWSNFDKDGYCVGIARSENGKVDGKWIQQEKLLYSKEMTGTDGGHGMIFSDVDSKMYLCIHSPNKTIEKAVIIPICEKDDTLVLQLD